MKCPQCGDNMEGGRCVFCGYRPTEADRQAYERWAEQKAQAERGFSGQEPDKRPGDAPRKERTGAPRRIAMPRKPAGDMDRGRARAAPARKPGKSRGRPSKARDGPGFFGRLVPRLVVLAWAALIVYLMVSELAAGMPP